jgi:hypothetical protein
MEIALYIISYLFLGLIYLFLAAHYDKLYDMFSPLQPIGFILFWPIHLILNIYYYIKNNIKF